MSIRVMADGRPYTRTDCREVRARHRPAVLISPDLYVFATCGDCGGGCFAIGARGGWYWRHRPGTFWRAHA